MKIMMNILKKEPPQLQEPNKNDVLWDQRFKDFIRACLQKDPLQRPSAENLMKQHKKFFSKAKNADFLRQYFLHEDKINPIDNPDVSLLDIGNEYISRKSMKETCRLKKTIEDEFEWDFGSGELLEKKQNRKGGHYSEMLQEKKKKKKEYVGGPKNESDQQTDRNEGDIDEIFDDLC